LLRKVLKAFSNLDVEFLDKISNIGEVSILFLFVL
jgi:hypothetical protein